MLGITNKTKIDQQKILFDSLFEIRVKQNKKNPFFLIKIYFIHTHIRFIRGKKMTGKK